MSPYNSAGEYINRMYTPKAISDILCQAAVQLSVIDAGEEQYAIRDMLLAVMPASELLTSFTTEDLKKLGCKSLDD